jgi:DNA-binding NtrC family response regulator
MPTIQETTRKFMQAIRPAKFSLAEMEAEFRFAVIRRALIQNNGNQVRASRELGIHRNTMTRILRQMRDARQPFNSQSLRRSQASREARE